MYSSKEWPHRHTRQPSSYDTDSSLNPCLRSSHLRRKLRRVSVSIWIGGFFLFALVTRIYGCRFPGLKTSSICKDAPLYTPAPVNMPVARPSPPPPAYTKSTTDLFKEVLHFQDDTLGAAVEMAHGTISLLIYLEKAHGAIKEIIRAVRQSDWVVKEETESALFDVFLQLQGSLEKLEHLADDAKGTLIRLFSVSDETLVVTGIAQKEAYKKNKKNKALPPMLLKPPLRVTEEENLQGYQKAYLLISKELTMVITELERGAESIQQELKRILQRLEVVLRTDSQSEVRPKDDLLTKILKNIPGNHVEIKKLKNNIRLLRGLGDVVVDAGVRIESVATSLEASNQGLKDLRQTVVVSSAENWDWIEAQLRKVNEGLGRMVEVPGRELRRR